MNDEELRYKVAERYAYGWTDPRSLRATRITWRYRLRLWWRDKCLLRVRAAWRWLVTP